MKLFSVLILITCLNLSVALSQEGVNVVSTELAGKGLIYSFNYERLFQWKRNPIWHSISIGYSGMGIGEGEKARFFPVSINKLYSKDEENWFEMGVVLSPALRILEYDTPYGKSKYKEWFMFPGVTLGYRNQPLESGVWSYKVNFYLYFHPYFPNKMVPYGGLTVGRAF